MSGEHHRSREQPYVGSRGHEGTVVAAGKLTRSEQAADVAAGESSGTTVARTTATKAAAQKLAPWVMDEESLSAMGLAADSAPSISDPASMWGYVIGERSVAMGKLARVRAPDGVKLRERPAPGQPSHGILPFDDLVSVERKTEHGWCWVVPMGQLASTPGFVEESFLAIDPPEPTAHLYRVSAGDKLRLIAERYYGKQFRDGRDARLYVQALYEANKTQRSVYLTEVDLDLRDTLPRGGDEERTLEIYKGAKVREGHALWMPSEAFIEQLRARGAITSGTSDLSQAWRGAKAAVGNAVDAGSYAAGFTVGMLEGGWSAIVELFQGAADMIEIVAKTVYQLFIGNPGAIKATLMGWVEKLKTAWGHRGDLAADFMAKWDSDDAWARGSFQGEVLGWVMMTALLILATSGASSVAAATGRWSNVLRVLEAADALGDVTTYVGKVARLPGKAIRIIRHRVGKVAEGLEKAGEDLLEAENDAARAISGANDGGASRPELENVSTSLDGHTFHNDIRRMSPAARHVIRQLEKKGWVRVSEITPEDLVAISKWFEKEIGVVQSPYGTLRIILGTEKGVLIKQIHPGELFLAHTHPVVTTLKSHFDLDVQNASRHVEAVIDWSGNVTYFSRSGIKNPTGINGIVEPLADYKAAFVGENGAIVGYADIDIVDQATGVTIKVKK